MDLLHIETLLFVKILFVFENSLVEKLLQFFIAVIDAKLLEAVGLEVLETRDI